MDFKTISTRRWVAGMTLAELMVATAIGSMVSAGVAMLILYSGRSFAALANYADLDHYSQVALDTMSREIRQVNRVISHTPHQLTFENWDGTVLSYVYDPDKQTLTRSVNNQPDPKPMLIECDFLQFLIYQRNPVGGTYNQYPTADPSSAKLVQLAWVCSRRILGARVNTESVQSAKIVIRNR